jgi:GDP-4-dehydro-6-deoxy-D-mannose reductase
MATGETAEVRVLITGAQGFIGRYLAADWLTADPSVTVLGVGRSARLDDSFTHSVSWAESRVPAPLPPGLAQSLRSQRYQYRALDVANTGPLAALVAEFEPGIIVHLAASLRDDPPARLVQTNIGTVVSLLEAVAQVGGAHSSPRPRIVFGSSGSVYGPVGAASLPVRETAGCSPSDPYAATKRAAEELGRILADRYGLPVLWARIFNPVGPGQDERHLGGWLGWQLAAIAAGVRPPVVSVGPLHTTRDYIDVRDTARALRKLAMRGAPDFAYNVASGRETSGQQIFDTLLELSGLGDRVKVDRLPARPADTERYYANVDRLGALGYRPRFGLTESLADVLAFYRDCVSGVSKDQGRTNDPEPIPVPMNRDGL